MPLLICPTEVVNAPIETVWALLTATEEWGDFFDIRVVQINPPGSATMGQRINAMSGPSFLRLSITLEFTEIDPTRYQLGLCVRFPFGVTVREDLRCYPIDPVRCRVSYNCDFSFPSGWRGALLRVIMRRELETGPRDSLVRLKRAAERTQASVAS
jgi:hypothetical protein